MTVLSLSVHILCGKKFKFFGDCVTKQLHQALVYCGTELGDFEAFSHVLILQAMNIYENLLQLLLKSTYYNLVLPNNSIESLFLKKNNNNKDFGG